MAATVVNTVVGKQYIAGAAPPGVTPELIGGLAYAHTLNTAIPLPNGVGVPGGVPLATFRQWNNFDRIRNTSDHLAVLLDV